MKYSIIVLFALSSVFVSAQILPDRDVNEIHFLAGVGLSSIHHQNSQRNGFFNGYAADIGVGYLLYFHRNWGIYTGVSPGIYNTKKLLDLRVFTPSLTDKNGYVFDLYTNSDYSEIFKTFFVNVPLMLHFQTNPKKQAWWQRFKTYKGFYAMVGVKAGIPLKEAYESKIATTTNAAYYPEFDNWAATQTFAGLGTFNTPNVSNGNLDVGLLLRLSIEAGVKWRMKTNRLLYTGAFCQFALNSASKTAREPFRNNIATDHITDFTLLTFSENIDMLTAGVIVRLALFQPPKRAHCSYKTEPIRR